MNKSRVSLLFFSAFLVALGLAPAANAENIDACGGVALDAESVTSCQFLLTDTCKEECQPVSSEKVCASRLTTTCDSECTETADVICTTDCAESCVTTCTADTEPPNCNGLCESDCHQDCSDSCAGAENQGQCQSSCVQCCSSRCDEECDGQTETACDPVCVSACDGSCVAEANMDCQIACQSTQYEECETIVTEECKEECETSGGAIFCDGQFLATGGDVQACATEIEENFEFHIDVAGSADGDGNFGGFGCSSGGAAPQAAFGLVVLGALGALRRRRVSQSR